MAGESLLQDCVTAEVHAFESGSGNRLGDALAVDGGDCRRLRASAREGGEAGPRRGGVFPVRAHDPGQVRMNQGVFSKQSPLFRSL